MSLGSHFSRSRLRSIAVAFSMVLAGVGLFSVGSAHADTIANSPTVDLGNYGISASPPRYVPGGDNIPRSQGALGNATELFVGAGYENTNQVISVQNGSTAWGTPVVTSVADGAKGSSSQQWYFQLIGWIDMHTPLQIVGQVNDLPNEYAGDLDTVPVYRILNYNGSSITCLDAYGGTGAVDSAVDSYGCDPNQANQTNQLWVISYPHPAGEVGDEIYNPSDQQSDVVRGYLGQYPEYSSALQTSSTGAGVIENVASLAANGWDTTQAPVLTASYTDLAGFNSPLKLESQAWPTLSENSTWGVVDPNAGSGSGSGGGQSPTCTGFACLVNPN